MRYFSSNYRNSISKKSIFFMDAVLEIKTMSSILIVEFREGFIDPWIYFKELMTSTMEKSITVIEVKRLT